MDTEKHVTKRQRGIDKREPERPEPGPRREPRRRQTYLLDQQETELEIREALRLGSGTGYLEDV